MAFRSRTKSRVEMATAHRVRYPREVLKQLNPLHAAWRDPEWKIFNANASIRSGNRKHTRKPLRKVIARSYISIAMETAVSE